MFCKCLILASLTVFSTHVLWAANSVLAPAHKNHADTVKVAGLLRMDVVAIGGETTGCEVRSANGKYQLDFAENTRLKQTAGELNGKQVIVEGSLKYQPGVETKGRWIVTVVSLLLAP